MSEYVKKVCICGDPSVGKTSLVKRFVTGKYDEKYMSTLGTVVSKKSVKSEKNKCNVNMMIWDISGQPEFKRIHASAFKNAAGALAVCDLTRPETAQNLSEWTMTVREYAWDDIPIIVLVNKSDLAEEHSQDSSMVDVALNNMSNVLIKTSAKTGENVEYAFKVLADAIAADSLAGKTPNGASKISNDLPPVFETALELFDYMAIGFCNILGDEEMGMHMVRKQVKDAGYDFRTMAKKEVREIIERFVKVIEDLKGRDAARIFQVDMLKAFDRCKR